MKTIANLLPVALLVAILLSGCAKKDTAQTETITGKVIHQSECTSSRSPENNTTVPDSLSCVDYSFHAEENLLILKHLNTGFNCCPGILSCEVTFDNDTIIIAESAETSVCNCNCLFDLDIEITGVLAKKYYLKFIEPYCGDQEKLFFEVDLKNQPGGSYCVYRYAYPWGI